MINLVSVLNETILHLTFASNYADMNPVNVFQLQNELRESLGLLDYALRLLKSVNKAGNSTPK